MKKIIYIICLLVFWSCDVDEFLDNPPQNNLTVDNFFNTDDQLKASGAILYGTPWFYFNYQLLTSLGDVYGGNAVATGGAHGNFHAFTMNSGNSIVHEGWLSLFNVVANANTLIDNLEKGVSPAVSQEVLNNTMGEARLARGMAYFYLAQIWGEVPILDNALVYATNELVKKNRAEDVFKFAQLDLEVAEDLLPALRQEDGRASQDVATAFLAKLHLTLKNYDLAKELAQEVINGQQYDLLPEYGNLYKEAYDNNIESIFALQWVACSGWGQGNTAQAWTAPFGQGLTEVGDGWGAYRPSLDLLSAYEADDARRFHTVMEEGNVYTDLKTKDGGYIYPAGISSTNANFRKYIVGSPAEGNVCFMSTENNTYLMRFADVLLIHAEATLGAAGSSSDPGALESINRVRRRAGLNDLSSFTQDDILNERRIEFAYEGSYWFDLARIDRAKAKQMLMDQERGEIQNDEVVSFKLSDVSDEDFLLPIPQVDIDKNPNLAPDVEAEAFNFNE